MFKLRWTGTSLSVLVFQQEVPLNRGEVLKAIGQDLTSDKLAYFVRAGYLNPKKVKRGDLDYNDFSKEDVQILKIAWKHIHDWHMKTKIAFQKARSEFKQGIFDL